MKIKQRYAGFFNSLILFKYLMYSFEISLFKDLKKEELEAVFAFDSPKTRLSGKKPSNLAITGKVA